MGQIEELVMLLDTLEKNFASKAEVKKPSPAAIDESCGACGGRDHWQPVGDSRWFCESCRPPPSEAFVGSRRGPAIELERLSRPEAHKPFIVCYGVDVCPGCHGAWIVETFGLGGGSNCFTCKRPIAHEEISLAIEKTKTEKF